MVWVNLSSNMWIILQQLKKSMLREIKGKNSMKVWNVISSDFFEIQKQYKNYMYIIFAPM